MIFKLFPFLFLSSVNSSYAIDDYNDSSDLMLNSTSLSSPRRKGSCSKNPDVKQSTITCKDDVCVETCFEDFAFPNGEIAMERRCIEGSWDEIDRCTPWCTPKCIAGEICRLRDGEHSQNWCYEPCEEYITIVNADIFTSDMKDGRPQTEIATCHEFYETESGKKQINATCVKGEWVSTEEPKCFPKCSPRCKNGGTCIEDQQDPKKNRCQCTHLYKGTDCHLKKCPKPCLNGGICIDWKSCQCLPGTYGKNCEFLECKDKTPNKDEIIDMQIATLDLYCQGKARKDLLEVRMECNPQLGIWVPRIYHIICEPICQPMCVNKGVCIRENTCNCPKGFEGDHCEIQICKEIPFGVKNGRFIIKETNKLKATLQCKKGYRLNFPEKAKLSCLNGEGWTYNIPYFNKVPPLCLPVCVLPCYNGGRCVAPDTCLCAEGFTGPRCRKVYNTASNGKKCIFPYKYRGQKYYACTSVDHELPWCPTTVASDGSIEEWGDCYARLSDTKLLKTKGGNQCVFPFKKDGTIYHDCIIDNNSAKICPISIDKDLNINGTEECGEEDDVTEQLVYTAEGGICEQKDLKLTDKKDDVCVHDNDKDFIPKCSNSKGSAKQYCLVDYGFTRTRFTETGEVCLFYKGLPKHWFNCGPGPNYQGEQSCPTKINNNMYTSKAKCVDDYYEGNEHEKRFLTNVENDNNNELVGSMLGKRTNKGHRCVFPFKLDGTYHFNCITSTSNTKIPICATKVDEDANTVESDFCPPNWRKGMQELHGTRKKCKGHSSVASLTKCISAAAGIQEKHIDRYEESLGGFDNLIDVLRKVEPYTDFIHKEDAFIDYSVSNESIYEKLNELDEHSKYLLKQLDELLHQANITDYNKGHDEYVWKVLEKFDVGEILGVPLNLSKFLPTTNPFSEDKGIEITSAEDRFCISFVYEGKEYGYGSCVDIPINDSVLLWNEEVTNRTTTHWCVTNINSHNHPVRRDPCTTNIAQSGIQALMTPKHKDEKDAIVTSGAYLCRFPFKYKDKIYTECVKRYRNDRPWCAISVKKDNTPYTRDYCIEKPGQKVIIKTSSDRKCKLPFFYENTMYTDRCFQDEESGKMKCPVEVDNDLKPTETEECRTDKIEHKKIIKTDDGKICDFPFKENGIYYTSCVRRSEYEMGWCATDTMYDRNVTEKAMCTTASSPMKYIKTIKGNYCDIPFTHDGKEYISSCVIEKPGDEPWCIVNDGKEKWKEKCRTPDQDISSKSHFTEKGESCKYPFKHNGVVYSASCVIISDYDSGWCASEVDKEGNVVKRTNCQHSQGNNNVIVANNGKKCKLPAKHPNSTFTNTDSCYKNPDTDEEVCLTGDDPSDPESWTNCTSINGNITKPVVSTNSGQNCIFPFELNGKLYTRGCAKQSIYDPGVCATEVDDANKATKTSRCDSPQGFVKKIMTTSGFPCILPFKFYDVIRADSCFGVTDKSDGYCPTESPDHKYMACLKHTEVREYPKTAQGKPCQFPLLIYGRLYVDTCIRVSDYDPGWCATATEGSTVIRAKGRCIDQEGKTKKIYSIDGRECIFPFNYTDSKTMKKVVAADFCEGESTTDPGHCYVFKGPDTSDIERVKCLKTPAIEVIKTVTGKTCVFPHTVQGLTYKRSCVKIGDYDPGWCAVKGRGGKETETCAPVGVIMKEVVSVNGNKCKFPFKDSNGNLRVDGCAPSSDGSMHKSWCATKVDSNGNVVEKVDCFKPNVTEPQTRIKAQTTYNTTCIPFVRKGVVYTNACYKSSIYDPGRCFIAGSNKDPETQEGYPCRDTAIVKKFTTLNSKACKLPIKDDHIYVDSCIPGQFSKNKCYIEDDENKKTCRPKAHTTSVVTTKSGEKCKFPYFYQGNLYTTCVNDRRKKTVWCATATNNKLEVVSQDLCWSPKG